MLPMSEHHDLEMLSYSERVDLAVQAMDRDPSMTSRRAAATFNVKRKSFRKRFVHEPAKALIKSTIIAPNDPEHLDFHALPVELICTILDNLESARDVVAVGQTSQTLRRVAIDHLCQNAYRYDAILWAIIARRRTLLQLLLQRGAALAYKGRSFISHVASAAGKGDEAMVRLLLNNYGTINNLNAAISEAVLRGHGHIVKLVLNMCAGMGLDYTEIYSTALRASTCYHRRRPWAALTGQVASDEPQRT